MDSIRITGITAAGTHGVLDFEHKRAQTFVVDATLFLDLSAAGRTDALADTVDYGRIAKGVVAIIEGEHVDLIEKLAQRIADMILEFPEVAQTQVTVHKPGAPITVPFADVSVTIERGREIHHAVVALGGNLGDVEETLRDAVRRIDSLSGTQVSGVSPLYRTAAWGMPEGTPAFLNAVVTVRTRLTAEELLDGLHAIEAAHGRTREEHWGNRTLDLDIIDFDGRQSDDPDLTLPHPRAWQRAFVLVPWAALDPSADLPGLHGGPVSELAEGMLAEAAGDNASDGNDAEPPVELVARDWMSTNLGNAASSSHAAAHGRTDSAAAVPSAAAKDVTASKTGSTGREAANGKTVEACGPVKAGGGPAGSSGYAADAAPAVVSRRAIISMDSTDPQAERLFREAIVAVDSIPGNQVEGISPLYHVSHFEGPDAMAAVMQISSRLSAPELIGALGDIESTHDKALDLDLVDMEGVVCDEPHARVPWPTAREHAAVLAPWLDMDPDARLGKDPVSYLLALAPDADRVGLLSADWILGALPNNPHLSGGTA